MVQCCFKNGLGRFSGDDTTAWPEGNTVRRHRGDMIYKYEL